MTEEWIKKLWCVYTVEYYSTIKRNGFDPVLVRWMNLEPVTQSEVSQKEKKKCHILTHICELEKWLLMNLFSGQEQRCRHKDQTCGRGRATRGWDALREQHGNIYTTTCKADSQWEVAV